MFKDRVLAYIVDVIYLLIVMLITLTALSYVQKFFGLYESTGFMKIVKLIVTWPLFLLIMWVFLGVIPFKGEGSIGKQIFGLRVEAYYGRMTSSRMFLREFLMKHLLLTPLLTAPIFYFFPDLFDMMKIYYVVALVIAMFNILIFLKSGRFLYDNLLYTRVEYYQERK